MSKERTRKKKSRLIRFCRRAGSQSLLVDVDQFVSERQGLRLSSDLGGVNRAGASDLGLGIRRVARSGEERPLTLSKAASRGLLMPKTGDTEVDGRDKEPGEQGKLLLEVETQYHNLM